MVLKIEGLIFFVLALLNEKRSIPFKKVKTHETVEFKICGIAGNESRVVVTYQIFSTIEHQST